VINSDLKSPLLHPGLMNNSVSLMSVLEDSRSISALVLSLSGASMKTKAIILELLAAVWYELSFS